MKLEELVTENRLQRMKEVAASRTAGLTLLFDELHHPHNISAVIRSADAFGVSDLHLLCSSSELSKGITMGTEKWVRVWCHENWENAVQKIKDDGYKLLLATAKAGVSNEASLKEVNFEEKICLVFGSEKRGPREELQKATVGNVYVEMNGFVESLNVSVAAATCIYHATFVADPSPPKISKDEQNKLLRHWLENEAMKKGLNLACFEAGEL